MTKFHIFGAQYPKCRMTGVLLRNYISLLFVIFISNELIAQGCGCLGNQNYIRVCYTSDDDYCPASGSNICGYTLNGNQMELALRVKLLSQDNFGLGGTVNCPLNLIELRKNASRTDIYEQDCHMIFLGNHAYDLDTGETDLFASALSDDMLNEVRAWSMECESNLVLLTQSEAILWGYRVNDGNENPNFPSEASSPVFNGPFGTVASFNQGGSFQANFTELASTGSQILAEDAQGRPTIVLDDITNDLILADVGILCSGAGDISPGALISNDNDVLACNIFALACAIADQTYRTIHYLDLCVNEAFQLPNGELTVESQFYLDAHTAENGCDSLIYYDLEFHELDSTYLNYEGCESDEFEYKVNGVTYNQNNSFGIEYMQNQYGCDSTIFIDMQFYQEDFTSLSFDVCPNVLFEFEGQNYIAGENYELKYLNSDGCDSIIYLELIALPESQIIIETDIEVTQDQAFQFENQIPADSDMLWTPSDGLSCVQCSNPTILPGVFNEAYQLNILDPYECDYSYDVTVQYTCKPYIPNIFSLNPNSQNNLFFIDTVCPLENYSISIYSRWGEKVFDSTNPFDYWDGKHRGSNVLPGVYVYEIEFEQYQQINRLAGNITVLP